MVRKTLRHCPRDAGRYYDQVAQIEMDTWTRGPVTLVGDACQAVSLMAGHDASMALGGAYVLADELRQGGPAEAAALRYQHRLRPLSRDKQAAGRRTARWLVPDTRWRIAARGIALSAAGLPGMSGLLRPAFSAMRASVVPDHRQPAERRR